MEAKKKLIDCQHTNVSAEAYIKVLKHNLTRETVKNYKKN